MTRTRFIVGTASLLLAAWLATSCGGDPDPGVMRAPKPPAAAPVETRTAESAPASAPVAVTKEAPPAPTRTKKELIADGEKIFKRKKCSNCHKTSGVFPSQGPNLANVGSRLTEEQMRVWIDNPTKLKPDTKMPPWDGTPAEFDALIFFLRSL